MEQKVFFRMKHLITILILTCATLHAQSVIVKGTGAGAVHATGAGSVRGVATPVPPRFAIQANTNVVLDNDSGLMWTRDANILGHGTNWQGAIDYCSNLTYTTYDDWRLPSIAELSRYVTSGGSTNGLMDTYPSANNPALPLGHPFTNIQSERYWTSVAYSEARAWFLYKTTGNLGYYFKTETYYVWPCRGP